MLVGEISRSQDIPLCKFTAVDSILCFESLLVINTSFQLVIGNCHPTISVNSAAQKFYGKVTRPIFLVRI